MASESKELAWRARDFASRLLAVLASGQRVSAFVDAYIAEFDRRGLTGDAARRRELLETIGREALLAMFARAQAQLPRHLTRRRPPILKGPEIRAAETFRQACIAALAQTLHWGPGEVEEFRRDADLYAQLGARQPALAVSPAWTNKSAFVRGAAARRSGIKSRKQTESPPRAAGQPLQGPFVDRAALLLDPSLMEKARAAAGKFLREAEALADQALAAAFRAKPR